MRHFLALVVLTGCLSCAQIAQAIEPALLDQLLKDYRAYGLPLPPADAQLVTRRHTAGIVNGVQQYAFDLAFSSREHGKGFHWVRARRVPPRGVVEVVPQPRADALASTEPADDDAGDQFDVDADLALAVACHARGWIDLATALASRSRQGLRSPFSSRKARPQDDRKALAVLAWNYWCNQFATETGDRRTIVARLKQLRELPLGLATPAHDNLIADMERTLAKRDPPHDRLEAAIESLLDLGLQEHSCGNLGYSAPQHKGYETLQAAGLEAAPLLIEHLADFRLTRCIQSSKRGVWHARIADIVAHLLNELANEEFAYDFLIKEGRGTRLDQAHVMHWWSGVQGGKARDYLRKHAIIAGDDGALRANESLLMALGQRHPEELLQLFSAHYEKLEWPRPLFTALGRSKATNEAKFAALLPAARHRESRVRLESLQQLIVLHHPDASAMVIRELAALPKTPDKPYWLCDAQRLALLAAEAGGKAAWAALAETARRVDVGQRMEMIQEISRFAGDQPEAMRFLAGFLGDATVRVREDAFPAPGKPESLFSGPCAGFGWDQLAVRDFAALNLARPLKINEEADINWKEQDWSRLHEQVRRALAATGDQALEHNP